MGKVSVEELKRYKEAARDRDVANYPRKRVCLECGLVAEAEGDRSAMEVAADHSTEHNPGPGQWAEAYRMIQQGRAKAKEKKEC